MSDMLTLTCRNHTGARYLTKSEFGRSLHFIKADPSVVRAYFEKERPMIEVTDAIVNAFVNCPWSAVECSCPASDLVEVVTCTKCDDSPEVYDVGLVLPFNLDGTTHDACFNKRFAVTKTTGKA